MEDLCRACLTYHGLVAYANLQVMSHTPAPSKYLLCPLRSRRHVDSVRHAMLIRPLHIYFAIVAAETQRYSVRSCSRRFLHVRRVKRTTGAERCVI